MVRFGRDSSKLSDIVIFDKDRPTVEYIIVEVKKPRLKDGKEQLKSYCNATGSPIAVWTNGEQISHYNRKDPNYFEDITDIPRFDQSLEDILTERYTWKDLVMKDKVICEGKSLKTIILEMEDEVLANAGVDVFEELFKLIFAKLYDESKSKEDEKENVLKIFGIDFDERAARVARTLNLIAGGGETNVLYLNSLDYKRWDEFTKDPNWVNTYGRGFNRMKELSQNKEDNQKFDLIF